MKLPLDCHDFVGLSFEQLHAYFLNSVCFPSYYCTAAVRL